MKQAIVLNSFKIFLLFFIRSDTSLALSMVPLVHFCVSLLRHIFDFVSGRTCVPWISALNTILVSN